MKKIELLLWGVMFSPLAILAGLVVYVNFFKEKLPQDVTYLQYRTREEFNGIVTSINEDRKNRSVETVFSKDDKIVFPDEWRKNVKVDDSISKKEGELFLKIFRNNTLKDSLNFGDIILPRRIN